MLLRILNVFAMVCLLAISPAPVRGDVTQAEIDQSLKRGIDYLRKADNTQDAKARILVAYTLAKTGSPHDHPFIIETVKYLQEQLSRSTVNLADHYYNAGLAAMLFDTLGGDQYEAELQALAKYILDGQHPHGAWYYPSASIDQEVGDTSITQYALLGLWALERNNIEIPKSAWSGAATWLANTQIKMGPLSGSFDYHPEETKAPAGSTNVKPSLGAAGVSSLLLCKRQLYPHGFAEEIRKRKEQKAIEESVKLYGGLLELIDVTKSDEIPEIDQGKDEIREDLIAGSRIQSRIDSGMRYLNSLPQMGLRDQRWQLYYLYGIERVGAFGEIDKIGNDDWYQTGAEALIEMQNKDGSWKGQQSNNISTCFAVLFLYRATAKSIRPPSLPTPRIGSGLLAGGRGLPSDLRTVQQKDGRIIAETADLPVTDLLQQLEANATAELRPVQEAVIETVRSEQRDELIGQVDRLVKLLKSPNAEVRAIAVWSLARSNDLTKAPLLIDLIRNDPDYDVAREANRGLCVLSRRLLGVGYNSDPVAGLDREQETKKVQEQILQWRASATKAWQDWYLTVRPYRERDDLLDLEE